MEGGVNRFLSIFTDKKCETATARKSPKESLRLITYECRKIKSKNKRMKLRAVKLQHQEQALIKCLVGT